VAADSRAARGAISDCRHSSVSFRLPGRPLEVAWVRAPLPAGWDAGGGRPREL